mmetsp:Transcript_26814/g.52636  ORF Transcript_26814/g.52636 Transcript_26814/m.52636 type:complete len:119 (+) Transcript_26814:1754-2110(+)
MRHCGHGQGQLVRSQTTPVNIPSSCLELLGGLLWPQAATGGGRGREETARPCRKGLGRPKAPGQILNQSQSHRSIDLNDRSWKRLDQRPTYQGANNAPSLKQNDPPICHSKDRQPIES